jgi:hypothetical protein
MPAGGGGVNAGGWMAGVSKGQIKGNEVGSRLREARGVGFLLSHWHDQEAKFSPLISASPKFQRRARFHFRFALDFVLKWEVLE